MAFTSSSHHALRVALRHLAFGNRLPQVAAGVGLVSVLAVGATYLLPAQGTRGPMAAIAALTGGDMATRSVEADFQAPPPRIWMSSLVGIPDAPFAAPDYAPAPIISRMVRVEPFTAEREGAAPRPSGTTTPAETTAEITPEITEEITVTAALDADIASGSATPVSPLTLTRAAPQDDSAERLAALRAPRRSLLPVARPQALVAALQAEAETQALAALEAETAPESRFAVIRSRTPQPRPEVVTRLASLVIERPVEAAAPAPAAPAIQVPPMRQALARADTCDSALTRSIPRRGRSASGGSQVIGQLTSVSGSSRDGAVISEVMAGNIPDHLRNLVPVSFEGSGPNGQPTRVTICVMPDYLAVGSDRDFVRVPLGLPAATRVAERFDMVLPTTRMVDAIYAQANLRLSPSPMAPNNQMASTNYFLRHNATVEGQLRQANGRLGQLVAGHKKDLVLTNRLNRNPGRVAIYGWHRRSGSPIQPLSTVHGAQYADYSHGIRLISRRAYVNGRAVDLRDLLSDSRLAALVSSEGTIANRQLLAALQ
ncbi:hypothetical protein [Pararhodobacter oceanensis]|uniref:Uncharacterized protein n=1 Tax=Pararhodobacter oceanensis TaxID=2172121 RepID=A0A2T8HXH8_9RHOB|nr:hypothetical protein [Pararhodobacter oceanensis]PVH30136.1 hypothetical protein DDE20_00770 [Pararhodobacter oceanensis]